MTLFVPVIFAVSVPVLVLYSAFMFKRRGVKWLVTDILLGLYISAIIALCFFPFYTGEPHIDVPNNLIPFRSTVDSVKAMMYYGITYRLQGAVGNFLLLMPLGVFAVIYLKSVPKSLLLILSATVFIESAQFLIGVIIGWNYRSFDVDDIILNFFGGALAAVIFNFVFKKIKHIKII